MRRWWRSTQKTKEGTAANFKHGFGFHRLLALREFVGIGPLVSVG